MNKNEFHSSIERLGIPSRIFIYGEARHLTTEPVFNIRKVSDDKQFAVKFFPQREIFIVWNLQRHRECKGRVGTSLSLKENYNGSPWDSIPTGKEVYHVVYKELIKTGSKKWQKICVVGIDSFNKFFKSIYEYTKINSDDLEINSAAKAECEFNNGFQRERYSTSAWKRDSKFSKNVLSAYGYKCAICRCEVQESLQAAHEHGYEPGKTSWDDPKHGICLCANHHLMYDADLIKIDFRCNSVVFKNPSVETDLLNEVFIEQYNRKMIERRS